MVTGALRRKAACRIAALCGLALAAPVVAGAPPELFPEAVPDVARIDERDLYLFIVDRGSKLTQCVSSLAEDGGPGWLLVKLHAAGRYPALVDAAASVLGSTFPAVQAARDHPQDNVAGIQAMIVEMARFGSGQDSSSMRDRLLRSKALYTPVVELAGVSDGRCVPDEGLVQAIARVQPEP